MIRALQKRINSEVTLVMSERSRHDPGLPTGTQQPLHEPRGDHRTLWEGRLGLGLTLPGGCL